MSYQVNLWNNYEMINNHFNLRRKGYKDLICMLNEKYKCEVEYARGMKRIFELGYNVTDEGTLGLSTKTTRDYFLNLYMFHNEFSVNIMDELIDPARKFIDDQISRGKKLYTDMKRLDKDYKDALSNLEKIKNKFHTTARNAESAILDSELAKLSYITPQEKEKFFSKAVNLLKEAKECEGNYLSTLKFVNNFRLSYIENTKNMLASFQHLDEEFIDNTKTLLQKFFIFSRSTHKNILYDLEECTKRTEIIDTQLDVQNFIASNETYMTAPEEIEYIPYTVVLNTKPIEETNYPPDVVYNVIVALQSSFEKTSDPFDPIEEKKKIQINNISKLACCNGDKFNENHKQCLLELIKEKKHRLNFLFHLNKQRSEGKFELNVCSFELIGNILIYILNEVINDKDYESARYCIILSQTFFFMKGKEKIFLQKKIENHPLLHQIEFWENFIAYSIFEEIEKSNNANEESDDDKNTRIGNSVFSQLLPITDNMLEFELEKALIEDVIVRFAKQYEIDDHLVADLVKIITDRKYIKTEDTLPETDELKVESIKENYWEESKQEQTRKESIQTEANQDTLISPEISEPFQSVLSLNAPDSYEVIQEGDINSVDS